MDEIDRLALMAAALAAPGTRTVAGAVATAREILDEIRRQEPERSAASDRRRMTDSWRRRLQDGRDG